MRYNFKISIRGIIGAGLCVRGVYHVATGRLVKGAAQVGAGLWLLSGQTAFTVHYD